MYPKLLGNMFREDGSIIAVGEFLEMVETAYECKLAETKKRLCRDCEKWLVTCNGACYPNTSLGNCLKTGLEKS